VLFHDCDLHNYTIKVHAWRAFNATWHQPFDRPNTCFVHAARFDSTLKRDRRLRNTQKRGNSFPQESSHFYTLFKTLARNYQRKFVLLNLNPLEQSRLHRDCVIFSFLSFFFFFFSRENQFASTLFRAIYVETDQTTRFNCRAYRSPDDSTASFRQRVSFCIRERRLSLRKLCRFYALARPACSSLLPFFLRRGFPDNSRR